MSGNGNGNGLTYKRKVFVEEYLKCWNGAEAARRAGYAYPRREACRLLTNADIHDALVELSKLDGAFVLRGDGFIQAAGVFLTSPPAETELVSGLGTRHAAAAAVTMRTMATAIVVSATDGQVRAFSGGKLVLQVDPEIAHGHISIDD